MREVYIDNNGNYEYGYCYNKTYKIFRTRKIISTFEARCLAIYKYFQKEGNKDSQVTIFSDDKDLIKFFQHRETIDIKRINTIKDITYAIIRVKHIKVVFDTISNYHNKMARIFEKEVK